jgi:hypothetical protein
MRLNAKLLGLAAAGIAALSFAVCAILVVVAPGSTTAFFSYVMHIDLASMARVITWDSFVLGMLIFGLIVGVHVWLIGLLYNALKGPAELSHG